MSEIIDKFTLKEDLIKYNDKNMVLELDLNDACSLLNAYDECWNLLLDLISELDGEVYKKVNTELVHIIFHKLLMG